MYIKKKNALIISLIGLLIVVGYINHELTKRSIRQSSTDYQQYEENQLAGIISTNGDDITPTYMENSDINDDLEIIEGEAGEIDELKEATDRNIESVITKEENLIKNNYFIEHRLSRDKLRASLIDRLNDIINNEYTNDEVRTKAQNEIIKIGQISELELNLEGLIKAKGFEDALVFLSDNNVRVIVSTDELTEQDVVKIFEIVKSETGVEASNIKIMEKQ